MNPDEASNKNTDITISIFVYGTLKKGYRNHDRFCRGALEIQPATTWGRLYKLPPGYPALEIPKEIMLAQGTSDPLADARTQMKRSGIRPKVDRPIGDWDLIDGEIITFGDPIRDLPPIDRLEGFNPKGQSYYKRALIWVSIPAAITFAAWGYFMDDPINGKRLTDTFY